MSLLEQWREYAYENQDTPEKEQKFWNDHFIKEQSVYEAILKDPNDVVTGTVKELAEKFGLELLNMVGVLDGINSSLKSENPVETMDEDTVVNLGYDPEKLYYNMVACKAEWLYTLPEWDAILSEERRKELYKKQRSSTTIVKGPKIGRNDPCPCGSGKKYKKCCGR